MYKIYMSSIKTYWYHDQFSPHPDNSESLSVVRNKWYSLLIDCPDRSFQNLLNDEQAICKSTISKVDHLLITHIDSDHISWVPKLIWYKKFVEWKKLSLITHPNIRDNLWKILEPSFWKDRTTPELQDMNFEDYVDFIPLDYGKQVTVPWFGNITTFERSTEHCAGMDVIAPKVFWENGELLGSFSADTKIDHELLEFLKEWDAPIIHEVWAYFEWTHSHTHINELLDTLPETDQQRTFINHIPETLEQQITKTISEHSSPIRFANSLNNI